MNSWSHHDIVAIIEPTYDVRISVEDWEKAKSAPDPYEEAARRMMDAAVDDRRKGTP